MGHALFIWDMPLSHGTCLVHIAHDSMGHASFTWDMSHSHMTDSHGTYLIHMGHASSTWDMSHFIWATSKQPRPNIPREFIGTHPQTNKHTPFHAHTRTYIQTYACTLTYIHTYVCTLTHIHAEGKEFHIPGTKKGPDSGPSAHFTDLGRDAGKSAKGERKGGDDKMSAAKKAFATATGVLARVCVCVCVCVGVCVCVCVYVCVCVCVCEGQVEGGSLMII